MQSPSRLLLHETHAALGAVFGQRHGRPVVVSYGDPAGEDAAAWNGAGLVDLTDRGVLEVTGPQRQRFLQGMLSNEVADCQPGQGCRAALLTPKGHVLALLRALVDRDAVLLETDADRLEALRGTLEHHRVAAPVRFKVRDTAILGLVGLQAEQRLRAAGVAEAPLAPEDHVVAAVGGHEVRVVRAGDLPGGGFVLHASPEAAAAVWEALRAAGAHPVGREALDAFRVETLRPWYGDDVTEDNLLHEAGLVRECHSPTKGCYLGQETVARLEARGGHVNKALRRLRLSAPASSGAIVRAGGMDAGRVTTAAVSPRLGPIALAYVHRTHFAPGTAVEVDGAPATVVGSFVDDEP
jgi:folate-binding protein YgfZ